MVAHGSDSRWPRRQASQPAFRLELTPLPRLDEPELRIVVSTKLTKKAVERNRLKRRLREIWRALPHPQGSRVTLYARPAALEMAFADLQRQLLSALKQL